MTALLGHVQPALASSDPAMLKEAFEAMAVCAEGCSDHIRKKHLPMFLQYIDNGIKFNVPVVRNAALYALGQFSEYLQPEISEFADRILPVLFLYLDQACVEMLLQTEKVPLKVYRS